MRIAVTLFLVLAVPLTAHSQTRSTEPASMQQKLVLSYFHDVLDNGKVRLLDQMFQGDCVIHRAEGTLNGVAAVRGFLEAGLATFTKFETKVHDVIESGDRVVVRITHRGVGVGELRSRLGAYEIKDKPVTWEATVIFRLKDGKIAEEWVSRDELGMLLSAGVLSPKGPPR
jgi:predicted SnoaL-like aldol condensation-catalyzing enzyme